MGNKVVKTFNANGSITIPAGVTNVNVYAVKSPQSVLGNFLLDTNNLLYAFGDNTNGQLGVGDVIPRSSPVAVLEGLKFKRANVSSSNESNFPFGWGLTSDGALYAWGSNGAGQLGLGDVTPRSSPVAVLSSLNFYRADVAANANDGSYGITPDGTLYMWGANSNGQLGVGDTTARSSPVAVVGGLKFYRVSIEGSFSIGLTTSGVAYGWGLNTKGNLGVGDVTSRSSPTIVLGGHSFGSVLVGSGGPVYAIDTSGAMYAWGTNANGQLGVGDVVARSSPVAVLGSLTFTSVVASGNSAIGITTDGSAYGWGSNTKGVLGVGDIIPRSSPVAVLGGLKFSKISIVTNGAFPFCIGLTTSGVAYAWGDNSNGQLGVGDVTARSSPVAVLGSLTFLNARAVSNPNARLNSYGFSSGGALYAWGSNSDGQLGDGTVTDRSSPVLVLGGFIGAKPNTVQANQISVTPGSSYTVLVQQNVAMFGSTAVGSDGADSVVVEYDQ